MSFDGRITRLERAVTPPEEGRTVTCVMLVDDHDCPLNPEEFRAFLDSIRSTDGSPLTIVFHSDNGRGDCGAHISYNGRDASGQAFFQMGPLIRNGHLVPRKADDT